MSDPGAGDGDAADSRGSEGDAAGGRPSSDRRSGSDGPPADTDPGAGDIPNQGQNDGAHAGTDTDPDTGTHSGSDSEPETPREWVRWFFATDHGAVVYLREIVSSVGLVLLIGLLLFGVSGLWPPMVAVESGSMNPHMQRGDLVFVMEEHRLAAPAAYEDTGVVTYRTGQRTGYTKFQLAGDVIVYQPDGNARTTPIIHRARFWVNESENWVANGKAQSEHLGTAESCGQLRQCPAPHAGFITKGDANARYDQVSGLSDPVRPAWVVGTAEFRIPWLGNIRLAAGQTALGTGIVESGTANVAASGTTSRADPLGTGHASAPGQCAWS